MHRRMGVGAAVAPSESAPACDGAAARSRRPRPAAAAAAEERAPQAPSSTPAPDPEQHAQLRLDFYGFAILTAGHVLHWFTLLHLADTPWRRVQPAIPLAFMMLAAAVLLRAPRFYVRHRNWLLPVLRLLVVLPSSARSVRVGSALMLERPPRPGWRGAWNDAVTMLPGTRTLIALMQGTVNALPPAVTLLTHAALLWFTSNASGYCSTELLSAPLTRQRMGVAASALEYAPLPLAALQPLSGQSGLTPAGVVMAGRVPSEPLCRCAVQFYMLFLGLLLPVFISAWNWQPPSPAAAAASGSSDGGGGPWEQLPLLQRLARHGRRALAATDLVLHVLAKGCNLPGGRLLALWYATCSTWLWCRLGIGL